MACLVLNDFFSQCSKRKLSLENDADEYHRKHKKIDYEEEKELEAHVVYASLMKFQGLLKVHTKGQRTETKTMEKRGGTMCIKIGMKNSSKKNFVYLDVIFIKLVSLDLLLKKIMSI